MSIIFLHAQLDLCMTIPREDPHFSLRYNALFLVGFNSSRKFVVSDTEVPFKVIERNMTTNYSSFI